MTKQVIDCYKDENPIINKKLKEVSIEEGLAIADCIKGKFVYFF